MFSKILIANRGEIAVRIIRACREMGIETVAIYSEADAASRHVWLADEAVHIGPAPPQESYLCSDKIVAIARRFDCKAVHPGYGFLSENADFAKAVLDADLSFIGPSPETIRIMGSKTAAREAMEGVGVPVVPGYQSSTQNHHQNHDGDEALNRAAYRIGYPLLVKAVAGGGGKGMRIVSTESELPNAIAAARREAQSAFGNDEIFLEKLVQNAHHIEFQIFGDREGNLVHLFERECSIQRRHQKIIEETPSPFLDDDLRNRMGNAAVAAAQAVNYLNAGTVEFLVDEEQNFYFLEMNTRLQVEHPITELVTGIDLVKLQIGVAAGQPLPFRQSDLMQHGHAIECRIYAEDPENDFLPSIGKLQLVKEPDGPGIRVDSGVANGDEVSLHYDPMLAKLIVYGMNRQDAIQKIGHALENYVVLGDIVTNIPFLRAVCTHPAFQEGSTTTEFVEHHFSGWSNEGAQVSDEVLVAAAMADLFEQRVDDLHQGEQLETDPFSPWHSRSGFRLGVAS
ncbi:acetyl-CoA carboxylase biotin carboxylase subunit [Chloroflexi bacterium TSY]|nr:acetyl-CoA carboxylase biotin carboxylase subunit [Chloroflexi bacterium TSY]